MALDALKTVIFSLQALSPILRVLLNIPVQPTLCVRPRSALLSCRPWIGDSRRSLPHWHGCRLGWADTAGAPSNHCNGLALARLTNSPSGRGCNANWLAAD